MPAQVESMFYTREKPWHGLGIELDNPPTSEDALVAADLNWNVIQKPVHTIINDASVPINGYKVNIRDKDGSVLGIVSDRYKVVQNVEAFDFVDNLLIEGVRYETAGSLFGGRKVWMLAILPKSYTILGDKIAPYLDAANIDLKSFTDDFYRKYAGARLKPVLENIEYLKSREIWVEVTTLLIPGLNDSKEEIRAMAEFLKNISAELPWHLSAYYPQYKSSIKATETDKITEAVAIGKSAGLKYVYAGNIPANNLENSFCPACGKLLISRHGYNIMENNIEDGRCRFCKGRINGFF